MKKISSQKSDFFQSVYDVVQLIPKGRVTTYGAIADFLSSKSSSRMVGWALNLSHHSSQKIPAHRVVNRNGMLTGKMHFSDMNEMQKKLEQEGVMVQNDKVKFFEKVFWNPTKELL